MMSDTGVRRDERNGMRDGSDEGCVEMYEDVIRNV